MTDEPIFWADLLAKAGHTEVGVLVEQSLVGETLHQELPQGLCDARASAIVAEAADRPDRAGRRPTRCASCYEAKAQAIVHCGFGFGIVLVNPALAALDWDPPRFMGTAFQNAWINPIMWNAIVGWTGVDQYDEGNPVGQRFLDRVRRERYGRRPEYCVPVVNRDFATVLLHAFADAHPLIAARRQGGARAGEDAARRVRRARHPDLVRQVDAPRLDGRGLPRGPHGSIPTA